MKQFKKLSKLFLVLLCVVITILFYQYKDIYYVLKTWYSIQYLDTFDDSVAKHKTSKIYPLMIYYKIQFVKSYNIQLALKLGKEYIVENRQLLSLQQLQIFDLLLAELNFYTKNYIDAQQYYWNALIVDPKNDNVRYNYELAVYYRNLEKEVTKSNIGLANLVKFEFKNNNNVNVQEQLPINISNVVTNFQYLFNIQENKNLDKKLW